jgi:two-component system, sensor histidine kinase and response regulator
MNPADPAHDTRTEAPPTPDILIVDDDPGMIRALGKALRDLGHLRFSTNGTDALRLISDSPPDLLLLDAQMPGLNGFEVLETLKASPAHADLPVIMVTSLSEEDFEQAGLEKGAADFIAKPVRPSIVQARVRTQLRLKQANDVLKQSSVTDRRNLAVALRELQQSHQDLQRTADELKVANESLLQFVRIASHDLREPLNTIVQFVGLVEEDHGPALPEDARHFLRLANRAGARMRTLLDDVVRYARLQNAEGDPPQPVSLDRTLAELRDALAARLSATGGQLDLAPLPVVSGHASLLSLLFQNLLSNALKFVPPGRVPRVRVSATVHDGRVRVEVSDNGIGIEPQHMDRLFQPFQRLHLRSEFEGSGLGLTISRQIAEAHGGRIDVRSVPGEGSVFTVHLPLGDVT